MSDATKIDDGGTAFPQTPVVIDSRMNWPGEYGWGGISVRDYFAAAALPGIVEQLRAGVSMLAGVDGLAAQVAHEAYALADAMIAARAKKTESPADGGARVTGDGPARSPADARSAGDSKP